MAESRVNAPVIGVVATTSASRRRVASHLEREGLSVGAAAATPRELGSAGFEALVLQFEGRRDTRAMLKFLAHRFPSAGIVCILTNPEWKAARGLLRDGASAIVADDDAEGGLALAVRNVLAGQLTLPSRLRSEIAQPVLSVREKQMLAMVVMGFSNPEISQKLHVAESTVKSHLSSAFAKLGVRSRNEATALILDPAHGLGTGILEISGTGRTATHDRSTSQQVAPASAA